MDYLATAFHFFSLLLLSSLIGFFFDGSLLFWRLLLHGSLHSSLNRLLFMVHWGLGARERRLLHRGEVFVNPRLERTLECPGEGALRSGAFVAFPEEGPLGDFLLPLQWLRLVLVSEVTARHAGLAVIDQALDTLGQQIVVRPLPPHDLRVDQNVDIIDDRGYLEAPRARYEPPFDVTHGRGKTGLDVQEARVVLCPVCGVTVSDDLGFACDGLQYIQELPLVIRVDLLRDVGCRGLVPRIVVHLNDESHLWSK